MSDTVTESLPFPRLIRTPEAARLLGLASSTLSKLRCVGGGPKFIVMGRAVAYKESDLREWVEQCQTVSISADHAKGGMTR